MKYHVSLKFLAVLLCTVFLLASLASAAAVISIGWAGLYGSSVEQLREEDKITRLEGFAGNVADQYAAEELGTLTEAQRQMWWPLVEPGFLTGNWYYTVEDGSGNVLAQTGVGSEFAEDYSFWVRSSYPVLVEHRFVGQHIKDTTEATMTPNTANYYADPTTIHTEYEYTRRLEYTDENGCIYQVLLGICSGPTYYVTLRLTPNACTPEQDITWTLAELGYQHRFIAIGALLVSLVLFAAALTYLCCAAGKKPGSKEVRPGALNRIPLDLYGLGVAVAVWVALQSSKQIFAIASMETIHLVVAAVLAVAAVLCLMLVGFVFAFAAQVKGKEHFWWHHSILGRVLGLVKKLLKKLLGWIRLLPYTWQWLLTAAGMALMVRICLPSHSPVVLLFCLAVCVGIVIYGATCYGKLLESVRRMSRGDLGSKVPLKGMHGCFREFALHLNGVTDVAVEAGRRQMTSERMKAELITNVSHDIKTPLTSIINYVDLLQKAKTQEDRTAYLEVLDRQSQRMKKLLEDLMEMSKASSGAMNCELTRLDAGEAVNQALGEFADKLAQARLVPVVQCPKTPVAVVADGRVTWRVLSNLLSNAVKYAMPGTRLYIDVVPVNGNVLISLKNISREALTIPAGELTERFVRGDASRNTEGSGLGLNIAKSLMELQRGQLQVTIDGDLFKVTLLLPEAK